MKLYLAALSVALLTQNALAKKESKMAEKPKAITMSVHADKSVVKWAGTKKIGSGHNGEIKLKSGTVQMADNKITGGEIVIDMKSLTVTDIPATSEDNGKLAGHLKNADFFDVEKYPTAKLEIKSAQETAPGKYSVTGVMTIKDKPETMTFDVELKDVDGAKQAQGKLSIDRTKFGVKYGSANFFKLAADRVINDTFDLEFTVAAK